MTERLCFGTSVCCHGLKAGGGGDYHVKVCAHPVCQPVDMAQLKKERGKGFFLFLSLLVEG